MTLLLDKTNNKAFESEKEGAQSRQAKTSRSASSVGDSEKDEKSVHDSSIPKNDEKSSDKPKISKKQNESLDKLEKLFYERKVGIRKSNPFNLWKKAELAGTTEYIYC